MNLNAIVGPVVAAVTPPVMLTVEVSIGAASSASSSRTPQYAAPVQVLGSVQALAYTDLMKLQGLNLQGERRKIYMNGVVDGIIRSENKGGDLITTPDGRVWKVAQVLEYWPDWVSAAVTLQNV